LQGGPSAPSLALHTSSLAGARLHQSQHSFDGSFAASLAPGRQIDIQDDGTITLALVNAVAGHGAQARIEQITFDVEPGRVYEGRVVKPIDIGAFMTFSAPGVSDNAIVIGA